MRACISHMSPPTLFTPIMVYLSSFSGPSWPSLSEHQRPASVALVSVALNLASNCSGVSLGLAGCVALVEAARAALTALAVAKRSLAAASSSSAVVGLVKSALDLTDSFGIWEKVFRAMLSTRADVIEARIVFISFGGLDAEWQLHAQSAAENVWRFLRRIIGCNAVARCFRPKGTA